MHTLELGAEGAEEDRDCVLLFLSYYKCIYFNFLKSVM